MLEAQDWCLECGAGTPDRLGRTPGWRSTGAVIGAVVVLAIAAVAVGYAALSHSSNTVVNTPIAAAPTTPAATTPTGGTPTPGAVAAAAATDTVPSGPPASTPPTAATTVTTPKVATPPVAPPTSTPPPAAGSAAPTPPATTPSTSVPPATTPTTPASTTPSSSTPATTPATTPTKPHSIVLDPDAANTYNPYGYTQAFGDPSLAIDGDPKTAWSAAIDPTTAPQMAAGLIVDLKSKLPVSKVDFSTDTPGWTVQIYGAKGALAPVSITDPAWVHVGNRESVTAHDKLKIGTHKFRWILLWITHTPPVSTAGVAPTQIDINEVKVIS
jgi:hypothetical protein